MHRLTLVITLTTIALLTAGGYAIAQDGTPTPAAGMANACASPQASPVAGSTSTPTADPNAPQGTPSQEASPCASPAGGMVIEMVDIAFKPNTLSIPANTDVVITLQNHGVLTHNFSIDQLGINAGDVPGGTNTTVKINAPAGTYQFYCNIPGHKEIGMVGTLTVN